MKKFYYQVEETSVDKIYVDKKVSRVIQLLLLPLTTWELPGGIGDDEDENCKEKLKSLD